MKLFAIYNTNNTPPDPIYTQTNNYAGGRYTGTTTATTTGTTNGVGTYSYVYDDYGMTTSINYNEQQMLSYTYKNQTNKSDVHTLTRKTYANGQVEEYAYQSNKHTVTHKTSASATTATDVYQYNFDNNGNITSQAHKEGNSNKICYAYDTMDEYNPQLKITGTNTDYTLTYTVHYDKIKGRATGFELYSFVSCESTESVTGNYTYDDEGRLASINYGGAWSEEYTYDALGRTVGILNGNYPNERQDFTFGYQTINGYETNRLVRITDNTYQGSDSTATYDTNGYITGITYANQTHTYEYDAFGRLTKETINGTPTTYTYDSANNIISKTVNGTSKNYTYKNNLLDIYGTYSFAYDKMGNPTTYKGNTFVWKQGRKLTSGTMNGKSFTYTYDPNGMRYKKKVGNVTTNFYYSGTQLLMEDRGGGADRIYYIYGASGISGMILQEGYAQYTYYFDKNTLGDIIAIRNSNGDVVARYTYDAWGNHKVLKASGNVDTNQSSIGNINPFRYRGYYYDTETGFYYLQTRYYDPTICRFINADNYELVAQLSSVAGQLNMYAYCGNNPVMLLQKGGFGGSAMMNLFGDTSTSGGFIYNQSSNNNFEKILSNIVDVLDFTAFAVDVANGIEVFNYLKHIHGNPPKLSWFFNTSRLSKVSKFIGIALSVSEGISVYMETENFWQGAYTAGYDLAAAWISSKVGIAIGGVMSGHIGVVVGVGASILIGELIQLFKDDVWNWLVIIGG